MPSNSQKETLLGTYLVTPEKLQRLEEEVRSHLATELSPSVDLNIKAKSIHGKEFHLSSCDDFLELDNPVSNPISTAKFVFTSANLESDETKSISIEYGSHSSTLASLLFEERAAIVIELSSNDSKWNQETMKSVQEQVRRSMNRDVLSFLAQGRKIIPFLAFMIAMFVIPIFVFPKQEKYYDMGKISYEDARRLAEKSEEVETQEEKVDFIYQWLREYLVSVSESHNPPVRKPLNPWIRLLVWPVLFCLGLFYYIIRYATPINVFVVGDLGEEINRKNRLRSFLLKGVMLTLILGILCSALVANAFGQ